MKTCRSLFVPVMLAGAALPLLASAQTTISSSTTSSTSTLSTTTATATSALVTVKGAVIGTPENVNFSGQAQVNARVVTDPTFGNQPTVVLSIDLSKVTGVGASTGQKYVVSSQQTLNRKLNAADWVQISFPFYASGASPVSSRVGSASFSLGYDVGTLKLTGAYGQIATP